MSYPFIDPPTGLPVVVKQSAESLELPFDFAALLTDSLIESVTAATASPLGRVSGASAVTIATSLPTTPSQIVMVYLTGGTHGEAYKITVRGLTEDNRAREMDCVLYVRDS